MSIFDIVLLGAALSMDAAAVGMANGMAEPRMSRQKTFLIALFFGFFQGGMPLLGYFGSSVFSSLVGRIAPYLSFMLLLFLGGKMLIDAASEEEERFLVRRERLRLPALTAQAVATSVDALAVGVSFMAQEAAGSLPLGVPFCALIIAATTFLLSLAAVQVGKLAGDKLSGGAQKIGGLVLVLIGIKLLFEAF